jgi:nitroimidazol reductase NimA-like FMN-containing flavoprotein (pyridoxamine 5'-phosphate oxidase superfamily)
MAGSGAGLSTQCAGGLSVPDGRVIGMAREPRADSPHAGRGASEEPGTPDDDTVRGRPGAADLHLPGGRGGEGASTFPPTRRTTPTRHSDRARYDVPAVHGVLDEALSCHVGYLDQGDPIVIPTIHVRVGDTLYLHSSTGSRLSRLAARGTSVCVTVTLIDGLVMARSWFSHSMNYRSVVVRGVGRLVADHAERRAGLAAVVDHVLAGRSAHSRPPTARELAATALVSVPLVEVSMKSRAGPPVDDEPDLALPHWAGVIGVRTGFGPALPAPDLPYDTPTPEPVAHYRRSARPGEYR